MASEHLERELKFDADPQYQLPDLKSVLPRSGGVEPASIELNSLYFDTEQHDLLSRGVTLRRRTGTVDDGWQLKVPTGDARTEIGLGPTDSDRAVPKELAELTFGLRRGKPLRRIVTVRTSRVAHRILDADGAVIIEIADDQVHSVAPGRHAAAVNTWREIEAELGPAGNTDDLDAVASKLIKSGLTASASPNKVAAALGVGPVEARAHRGTAGEVIRRYLAEQDDALLLGDMTLRRGLGGIHPTRVATRRLRSTLRIFADYFDADRAAAFDAELSWYAALLGEVRDREVQRARFAAAVDALPDELVLGPVAAGIEQYLLGEQLRHQAVLDRAMTGRRYAALLRDSGQWADEPPFTIAADRAATRLHKEVRRAARKVDKHLAAGLSTHGDAELHRARKAGKRARYAAELAHGVLGKKARKSVKRYQRLQDILGDHQDGVVAADLLRRLATRTADNPGENGFTYGLLYAREQNRADTSRRKAAAWAKRH